MNKIKLKVCSTCFFDSCPKKEYCFCSSTGSVYYDEEVDPYNTCNEWEEK